MMGRLTGWERMRRKRLAGEENQKVNARHKKYREANSERVRAKHREDARAIRAYRRELGVCVQCGREDAFKPFKYCPVCLEKNTLYAIRASNKKKRRKND